MGRKKIWIPIAIAAVLILGFMLYSQMRSKENVPVDIVWTITNTAEVYPMRTNR